MRWDSLPPAGERGSRQAPSLTLARWLAAVGGGSRQAVVELLRIGMDLLRLSYGMLAEAGGDGWEALFGMGRSWAVEPASQ